MKRVQIVAVLPTPGLARTTVWAGLMVLLAALVVSCGPAPRPSPSSGHSPSAAPSSSADSSPVPAGFDIDKIPQSQTTLLLDVATDGQEIVWSRGDSTSGGAPDLYRYAPGAAAATLLYEDPDRKAQLSPLAVHNGHYAFVELWDRAGSGGQGGWRLWYVDAADQKPRLIDTSETDPPTFRIVLPQISLTSDRLIWTAVHLVDGQPRFSLRSYLTNTGQTGSLLESPADNTEYWFPDADDQERLVYSTVEYSSPGAPAMFRVYYADLTEAPLRPRRLDTGDDATRPVLSGDLVFWKRVTGNVSAWGQLTRYSLETNSSAVISFTYQSKIQYLSAGDRFVAVWGWESTVLELYDLIADDTVVIDRVEPTSSTAFVRPIAAGDIVVFIVGDNNPASGIPLQLCWFYAQPSG